ncbi:MAG: hypothetical protein AB7W59_33105, partial [Acidimicrobiia bacterium]
MKVRRLVISGVAGGLAALAFAGQAFAQDAPPTFDPAATMDNVRDLAVSTNLLWVIIGATLVVFMQAGFALVETGFCRAKHAAHVVSTNFAIFGLGFIGFMVCGFAFAFSGFSYGAFGMDASIGSGSLVGSGNWVFLWGKAGYFLSG